MRYKRLAPCSPRGLLRGRQGSPGDAAVGSHDEDRRHVTLQGPVEEGEALNVQHVDLVDEQHLGAIGQVSSPRPPPHAPLFPLRGWAIRPLCASGITANLQNLFNRHLLSDTYILGSMLGP